MYKSMCLDMVEAYEIHGIYSDHVSKWSSSSYTCKFGIDKWKNSCVLRVYHAFSGL